MSSVATELTPMLSGRLSAFARLCGREPQDIIRAALEGYLGKVTIIAQPVVYQLEDGQWSVEAVEKIMDSEDRDGNPVLLARFYGTLGRDKDKGDRLMSAMIALKGLTQRASAMEILNADWVSMKRDLGI